MKALTERTLREMKQAHVLCSLYGYDVTLPELGGWTVDHSGVYICETNAMGNAKVVTACRVPVVISALFEDVEKGDQGVELAFYVNKSWQFLTCKRSDIADRHRIVALADKGLPVTSESSRPLVRYLNDFLYDNIDFIAKNKVISRLGWYRERFVPYCEQPRLSDGCEARGLLRSEGSFEKWQTCVKRLIQRSPQMRTFLSSSFASVLLEPLRLQNFMVHLWGKTGAGKSAALMVAASVWGNPDGKLFGTMNGTLNFFQSQASMLRNIPLFLDELQTVRESDGNYDKLIMQLGVGVGRGRADRTGAAKRTVEWRNVTLCTGEEPIIRPNSGGGTVNRVLQLCTDDLQYALIPDGAAVALTVSENHGEAGVRFIRALLNENGEADSKVMEQLKETFKEYHEDVLRAAPTSGKQAAILAAIMTADTLADVVIYQTGERLQVRDVLPFVALNDAISKANRAMEYVRNMISIHINDFVGFGKDERGNYVEGWGHQPSGRVYGKLTEHTATINKQVLCDWLDEGGYSFDAVKKQWADNGFLYRNTQGKYHVNPPRGMTGAFLRVTLTDDPANCTKL